MMQELTIQDPTQVKASKVCAKKWLSLNGFLHMASRKPMSVTSLGQRILGSIVFNMCENEKVQAWA